jgi:hypothetical protein
MSGTQELVRFSDRVECRFDADTPLGVTLMGRDAAGPVQVSLLCAPPMSWPATFDAPVVLRTDADRILVKSGASEVTLRVAGVFVHRDVTRAFEGSVPPRRAPLGKRLFWSLVLALAGTSIGRRLLLR